MTDPIPNANVTRRRVLASFAGLAAAAPFIQLGREQRSEITLRYTSHVPRSHGLYSLVYLPFAEQVERETNGRIRLVPFTDKILHGALDGFKAANMGITDYTHGYATYQPGCFQLLHGLQLPFLFPGTAVAAMVAEDLYPEYFKEEYERMGIYLAHCDSTSPYNIISRKPIRTLEDLRGVKMRTTGGLTVKIAEQLGAVPIVMAAAEVYPAFQRGVVDAVSLGTPDIVGYRLHEIGGYFTHVAFNVTLLQYCLNKKTFDALPDDLRGQLYRLFRQRSQLAARNYYGGTEAAALSEMVASGVETIELPEDEKARWVEAVRPLATEFVAKNEALGLPAGRLLRDIEAKASRYSTWSSDELFEHAANNPIPGIIDL